jgi:hypothetical protein
MTDLRGYHLGPSEGKAWWFLDTLMIVKAGGQDAHDSFTLIEFRAPNGFAPPCSENDLRCGIRRPGWCGRG